MQNPVQTIIEETNNQGGKPSKFNKEKVFVKDHFRRIEKDGKCTNGG